MTSVRAVALERARPARPGAAGISTETATGHRIGHRYYSVRNRCCYQVLGVATTWELAPCASVTLRWDNGNTTTTALDRGLDPELCPSCGGRRNGPASIPVARCRCRIPGPVTFQA